MRTEFPLYEGDGIIHRSGALALSEPRRSASALVWRSPLAVVGNAFRDLFLWLEASAYRVRCRELERYLADSGDVFELERRIRNVERRQGAGFDPYF
jgi:transposase